MTSGCRPRGWRAPQSSSPSIRSPPTRRRRRRAARFAFRIGNASVNAEFMSETARIDLNTAPKELLAGLFASLGAPRAAADYYADRIIGWRSPPAEGKRRHRSRASIAPPAFPTARAVPLPAHRRDSALVLGIPDLLVERALPFLTVYSGQPQINILDAAPQVIAALPGMDPARLNAVLVQREAGPQNAQGLLAMLGPAQALATTQGSKALRVTARIAFDSGQRMTTEAVIFILDSGTEPYRILTWRDDIDDTPGTRVAATMTGLADITALFLALDRFRRGRDRAAFSSFGTRKTVQVIEEDEGSFVIQTAGATRPPACRSSACRSSTDKSSPLIPTASRRCSTAAAPSLCCARRASCSARSNCRSARPSFSTAWCAQQIDRLTPWSANDAAFGWSEPAIAGADRMVVTVAATARTLVQPLVDALIAAGAEAVTVTATPPGAAPITVLDHQARGALDFTRVRACAGRAC